MMVSRLNRWRHPWLSLVVPALLVALGAWQVYRIDGAVAGYEASAAGLQTSLQELQALAQSDPGATVRFRGEGRPYTAGDAAQRLAAAESEVRHDLWIERVRMVCAWLTVGGGGVACAAALGGLLLVAAGARRGRRSRAALVGAFGRVVRALPLVLGMLAVSVAAGVLGAVLFEVGGLWFTDTVDVGEVKLVLAGLLLAGAAVAFAVGSVRQLRRALDVFKPRPMQVLGREAGPAEAAGLWSLVRQVAAAAGAGAPDHIVLGLTEGFYVTSSRIRLAPEEREIAGRTLHVPATLTALLDRAELTAVIAHELAHFTGEDTEYSQHFLPLFASMQRSLVAVAGRPSAQAAGGMLFQPTAMLAGHVLGTFERVVQHWSRLREFEADQASLRPGEGGRATARVLLRSRMGDGLADGVLGEVFRMPDHAGRDVVGAVLARAGSHGFIDAASHLEDRQPHPTDSHPPTRQRIEALGVTIDEALLAEASRPVSPADTAFVESLFTDWPSLRQALGDDLLAVARAQDRRRLAELQAGAEAMPADVAVRERAGWPVAMLCVAASVVLLSGAALLYFTLTGSSDPAEAWIGLAMAASAGLCGALLLWAAWGRHRRSQAGPFLVLSADGFQCDGIAGRVAWSGVEGIRVTTGSRFVTAFHFRPEVPLPEKAARRWYVKVDRRRRVLELHGYVPRGMKAQAYLDLLNQALRAQRSRALLAERAELVAARAEPDRAGA